MNAQNGSVKEKLAAEPDMKSSHELAKVIPVIAGWSRLVGYIDKAGI